MVHTKKGFSYISVYDTKAPGVHIHLHVIPCFFCVVEAFTTLDITTSEKKDVFFVVYILQGFVC